MVLEGMEGGSVALKPQDVFALAWILVLAAPFALSASEFFSPGRLVGASAVQASGWLPIGGALLVSVFVLAKIGRRFP